MKELTIEVPEGYEIDKENSTFERIRFKEKQKIRNYYDLVLTKKNLSGYIINSSSEIVHVSNVTAINQNRNLFLTKEEAISARAASMISQMMPYYGGAITDEEWTNGNIIKYIICRYNGEICFGDVMYKYQYLAFRSKELRDEFLENCKELVKQYLMIK